MKPNTLSQLIRVAPTSIVINPREFTWTAWDKLAVQQDLTYFVSQNRDIQAIPEVRLVRNSLVLVTGQPFVLAALEATPPLESIVCRVTCTKNDVQSASLTIVDPGVLAAQVDASACEGVLTMIFFEKALDEAKQAGVDAAIIGCRAQIRAVNVNATGNYSIVSMPQWIRNGTTVVWKWAFFYAEGFELSIPTRCYRHIHETIAPIRSLNGVDMMRGRNIF